MTEPTDEEWQEIEAEFMTHGSCACDGYYDSGCPACNGEKRAIWLAEHRKTENPEEPGSIFD